MLSSFLWLGAVGAVATVEIGLRTIGLARLASLLRVRVAVDESEAPDAGPLPRWAKTRIDRVRRVVALWPFEGRCLREATAVALLLRRLNPVVCLGVVRSSTGALNAHAWVEVRGLSYDPEAVHYARLLPVTGMP